jgi:2-hydroxy-6-oxo-6-(2'-carboxyphenyl)-hexa-2,4-dienoate hydrolase
MLDRLDESCVRFVDVGKVRTRVYEDGAGEPLVLIHGGGFGTLYSLDSWSLVLPPLAERFRVVAFDKLGQGHTGEPRNDDYTFGALLSHTLDLLDSLTLGPAHLVGHSMGAFLGTRIAIERPDLARTLVLVDSNTTAPDDPRYPWTAFYDGLEARLPPDHPTRESVRMEPVEQSSSPDHVTDDFVERLYAIALLRRDEDPAREAARAPFWTDSIVAARQENLRDLDERGLPVPTLVVWGADDPSAPVPLAYTLFERIARRTEHAELHVLARAGHYSYREQPDAFTRLLAAFCLGR